MITYKTKAARLLRSCGAWSTARYLRNRGYDIGQALDILGMPRRFAIN